MKTWVVQQQRHAPSSSAQFALHTFDWPWHLHTAYQPDTHDSEYHSSVTSTVSSFTRNPVTFYPIMCTCCLRSTQDSHRCSRHHQRNSPGKCGSGQFQCNSQLGSKPDSPQSSRRWFRKAHHRWRKHPCIYHFRKAGNLSPCSLCSSCMKCHSRAAWRPLHHEESRALLNPHQG